MAIGIIGDGVWCKTCKKYHPTLSWHRKYGYDQTDAGIRESVRGTLITRPVMLGLGDDADTAAIESAIKSAVLLNISSERKYILESEPSECVICGSETMFVSTKNGRSICSDECLYRENGWGEECTGATFEGNDSDSLAEYEKLCRERNWPWL